MTSFSNWSGNLQFSPEAIQRPDSIEAIVKLVNDARESGKRVRVVGSAHSWMPLIETNEVLVSLDRWQGVESVDREANVATVHSGTKLARAGRELFENGVSPLNMGDIDVQAIAGAFFTGTHGTGVDFPILASQLVGVTLVTADGEVVEWHEETHPDEMNAVRVSFGAFGIVVRMQIRVQPAYRLQIQQTRMPLQEILADLETLKASNRNFEFFWFPHCDTAVVKRLNITERPITKPSRFMTFLEDHAVNQVIKLGTHFPKLGPKLNRGLMQLVDAKSEGSVAEAYLAYPATREIRFNEMEYNVPADRWRECFEAVVAKFHEPGFNVVFPVECRWVKQDDIWLSPAYQRESAYIAVHHLKGVPYQEKFAELESIFRQFDGRPHWGKLNTMSPEEARANYPRLTEFAALRKQLDPSGLFSNDYLDRMFG